MQFDLWNRRLGWLSLVAVVLTAGGLAQIRAAAAEDVEKDVATGPANPSAKAVPAPASVPLATPDTNIDDAMKKAHEAHDAVVKEMQRQHEQMSQKIQADNKKQRQEMQQRMGEQQAQTKKLMEGMLSKRIVGGSTESGRFWLGIECREAAPELRAQLGLEDGQGLVVLRIAPESPAAAAGLKQHDVLVLAGEAKLARVPDLSNAANAGESKPLELGIIRSGKQQKITVTPAERQDQIQFIAKPATGMLMPSTIQFQSIRLPDNMSVNIARTGQEPAKVSVKRGEEHWEVSADDLSKLPDDVRPIIEQMLNGPPGILKFSSVNVAPGTPGTVQVNGNTLTVPPGITITPGGGNTFRLDAPNFQYKVAAPGVPAVATVTAAPGVAAVPMIGSGTLTITTAPPPQPVQGTVTVKPSQNMPKQSRQVSPDIIRRLDQVTRELEKTQQDLKLLRKALPASAPKGENE